MKRTKHQIRRQGDIIVVTAGTPRFDGSPTPTRPPAGYVPVDRDERGRLVFAEGETTGHCHAVLDDAITLFASADLDEMAERFASVEREVTLLHEEHAPFVIPEGEQIVRRKREYVPEAPRYVAD